MNGPGRPPSGAMRLGTGARGGRVGLPSCIFYLG